MELGQKVLFEAWHGNYINDLPEGLTKVVTRVVVPTIQDLYFDRGIDVWDVYDLEEISDRDEYNALFKVKAETIPFYTEGELCINTVDVRTWWNKLQKGDFNSMALLFSKLINVNSNLKPVVFESIMKFIISKEAIAKSFIGLIYTKFLEDLLQEKSSMLDDDCTSDDTAEEYNNSVATEILWKMYTLIGYMNQNLNDFSNALKLKTMSEIQDLVVKCKYGDLSMDAMLYLLYEGQKKLEFSLRGDFEDRNINIGLRVTLDSVVLKLLENIYVG